jgi:hypothetical protein
VLDGGNARPGVYADPAGSLTLVNVDVVNARNNYDEAPGVWAKGTPVTIKGGRFENNEAAGPGGAVFFQQVPGQRRGLVISSATFVGNTALSGGGVFLSKKTTKARRPGEGGGVGMAGVWRGLPEAAGGQAVSAAHAAGPC